MSSFVQLQLQLLQNLTSASSVSTTLASNYNNNWNNNNIATITCSKSITNRFDKSLQLLSQSATTLATAVNTGVEKNHHISSKFGHCWNSGEHIFPFFVTSLILLPLPVLEPSYSVQEWIQVYKLYRPWMSLYSLRIHA